mmetsp:Transcript_93027/g.182265  ORF Transcript_93027/g.182265 Transcript_93027/m.182265 type:complete len:218 (+) Transcript_93027:160-813(+)
MCTLSFSLLLSPVVTTAAVLSTADLVGPADSDNAVLETPSPRPFPRPSSFSTSLSLPLSSPFSLLGLLDCDSVDLDLPLVASAVEDEDVAGVCRACTRDSSLNMIPAFICAKSVLISLFVRFNRWVGNAGLDTGGVTENCRNSAPRSAQYLQTLLIPPDGFKYPSTRNIKDLSSVRMHRPGSEINAHSTFCSSLTISSSSASRSRCRAARFLCKVCN